MLSNKSSQEPLGKSHLPQPKSHMKIASPVKTASPIRIVAHAGVCPGVKSTLMVTFPSLSSVLSFRSMSNYDPSVAKVDSKLKSYLKVSYTMHTRSPMQVFASGNFSLKSWAPVRWSACTWDSMMYCIERPSCAMNSKACEACLLVVRHERVSRSITESITAAC